MSISPMIDLGYFEMMVHPAMCVHPDPKKVLVITPHAMQVKTEIAKYRFAIELVTSEALSIIPQQDEGSYDVVIIGQKQKVDLPLVAHLHRILSPKGVAVVQTGNFVETIEEMIETLKVCAPSFRIAVPYRYESRTQEGFLFLSKYVHPLADVNLQRLDLTDGFGYYNTEVHHAAVALPTYVRKMVAGVVKNCSLLMPLL